MLKSYLITALRNFRNHKAFSLINVLGLSVGICAALVIYLIVQYDFSFDRFEKDGDRLYRVVSDYSHQNNPGHTRGTQAPLVNAVKTEMTGLEEVVALRYFNVEKIAIPGSNSSNQRQFKDQKGIIFADDRYFDLIQYHWLAGSPRSALLSPGAVVLTETRAKQYFSSLSYSDMIGRRIDYVDSIHATVAGVVKDLAATAHTDFFFQEFISLRTILDNPNLRKSFAWDDWGATTSNQELYVKLQPGIKAASVETGLNRIFHKYQGDSEKQNSFTWTYRLQPLSDIHFNGDYGTLSDRLANKPTLYGLLLIAGFLLFLGSINFINLTTAQASQRAREIGIRKTLGSSRKQLILQFLNETFLITLAATLLSIALAPLLLKIFADFIPDGLHFSLSSLLHQPTLMSFLALLVVAITLLSGFYPAILLSSWRPVEVLKNQAKAERGKTRSVRVRQILTVSQFVIAQAFIMGTLLVSKQIHFLLNKDLGFTKEAIVSVNTPYSDTSSIHRLYMLSEIKKIPGIAMASLGSDVPASGGTWTTSMTYKDGKNEIKTSVECKLGDSNYLRIFHIPLLAGRNVLPSDTIRETLINENYLHVLGFKEPADALGKILSYDNKNIPIVGVVKDFHTHALNTTVKPLSFSFQAENSRMIILALQPRSSGGGGIEWKSALASLEQIYKRVYPDDEFKYAFLDKDIAGFYKGEQRISDLLKWTTGLTIFISCLGLLGLVIFTTNLRTKEIGVRKVLGATVTQIVSTLSKDFFKLILLGFMLATPLAWWAVQTWMEQFVTRTAISWWVFALSGLAIFVFAAATLSIQTIRAARANPVKSLRTE